MEVYMDQWQNTVNRGGVEHVLKEYQPLYVQLLKIKNYWTNIFFISGAVDFVSKHMFNKPISTNKHYYLILFDILYNILVLVLFNHMVIYHFFLVHVVIFAIVVIWYR